VAATERTEKPTQKRLDEARKRGQLARSRDVVQVAVFAAALVALQRWGVHALGLLEDAIKAAIVQAGAAASRPIDAGDITQMVVQGGALVGSSVGPIAAASAMAAVAASVLQTGWVVASEGLTIDWGRLSPANGLKRIGNFAWYELLKMTLVAAALGYVAYQTTEGVIADAPRMAAMPTIATASDAWATAAQLAKRSLLVLAVAAAADFAFQKYRHLSSLRMTKQEVKDEQRQSEGNPMIKSRIRRIQREMSRKRMLLATKKATVVITNPTHFAVALEYRREGMAAPRVVAKGTGLLAQRIKEIAREAGVPMVENVPLAQALYKSVEVGDAIPNELFEAVAEVLAYLIRLKQLVL
jgi:flagellar biosynthetic protein FlhB